MMNSLNVQPYRIERRAVKQGSRPSVPSRAEIEKCVTGCNGLSPFTTTPGTKTQIRAVDSNGSRLSYNNIKIATINVRTLQDDIKLAKVIQAAQDCKIDVLAMQETRRIGSESMEFQDKSLKGWKLVWSGCKRKRLHGVGVLLAPHVQLESFTEHLPARILSCMIICKGMKLAILNVYSPTDSANDAAKAAFYSALNKAKTSLDETPSYKIIPLGDFNATISSASKDSRAWDYILGCNNPDKLETSNNGERMLNWCLKNKMKIMNTIYRTKRIHHETWKNPHTGKWKRIDYICTSGWLSQFVKSCRVYIGPSVLFDTDHRLLVMDMAFPNTKRQLKHHLSRSHVKEKPCLTDFKALQRSVELQNRLTEYIEDKLDPTPLDNVDDLNDKISTVVREGMDSVCPKIAKIKKREPWIDETLEDMTNQLKKLKEEKEIRRMQKKIKERRNYLKNEYYQEMADSINNAAQAREVEKEFALLKKYSAFRTGKTQQISNEKLKAHFQQHFSARKISLPPELDHPEEFPELFQDEKIKVNEECPNEEEVQKCRKSFKNGKSAGTDKMKTEGVKYNESNLLVKSILALLTLIWTLVAVPTVWLHASITCLYKKGVMSEASNYRGISIGANMSRILAKIILARFNEAYEKHLGESQFGFRSKKSTSDAMFVVNSIVEKHGGPLIAVYIDLTAAYDHIPRDFLFRVLELRTGAYHLVAILRKMYNGTTAVIKGMSSIFQVLVGCRQGGQESPCLFNYYFDFVLKVAASEIDKRFPEGWGIKINYRISHLCTNREQRRSGRLHGAEIIQWILYADNAVLFCKTPEEAQEVLTIINTTCKRFGLTISFKKNKNAGI